MASISSLSKEYVKTEVSFTVAGVDTDPTADIVQFAFVAPGGDPVTWYSGSWEVDNTTPSKPLRYARCLVGPGGAVTLAKGDYIVWLKIGDSPEIPVKQAGLLEVQ